MSSIYESNVDPLRPNDAHGISLQLVGRDKRVLELGAASGHVTRALKQLGNEVTAIERDGRFAELLNSIADDVHITDLDWLDLRTLLKGQTFDAVLAGDVLEHCSRPDLVLLQCHHLLRPDGCVVVSLPNVAHADVRLALLTGKFEYRPTGLLDQTHLRFFTRETIEKFVSGCGFAVESCFASTAPLGGTEFGPPDTSIPREAIEFVQRDRDSNVYQYVVRLVPVADPRLVPETSFPEAGATSKLLAELGLSAEALAFVREQLTRSQSLEVELQTELGRALTRIGEYEANLEASHAKYEANLEASHAKYVAAQQHLEQLQSHSEELEMKLLHLRDAVIGTSAELGTMRSRYETAQSEVDSLVHQLNLLHTSRTWRIGRFVLLPLRGVRWFVKKLIS
jgi:SAM-dependent methyltransferase